MLPKGANLHECCSCSLLLQPGLLPMLAHRGDADPLRAPVHGVSNRQESCAGCASNISAAHRVDLS